ncbi:MAG: hypothetical protein NUV76_06115 [Candidatus Kuenenia sp.]|nr:hypothetical protein [Candidatus Kuenenia sp.]
MGHSCRICGKTKSNESFSGKGHKKHICKKCSQRPKNEIGAISQREEICKFLEQSYISEKNISRLEILARAENVKISELASLVLEVAKVKPNKKRRLEFIAQNNRELLEKLEASGLLFSDY